MKGDQVGAMRVKYHRSLARIVPYLCQTILSQNARFHGASRELCRTLFQWIAITPIAPQGSPCQALLFVHSIPKFRKTFVPCARPRLRTQVRPLPPFRKTRHGAQRNDAPARSGITNDTAWWRASDWLGIGDPEDLIFVAWVTIELLVAVLAYVAIMKLWRYCRS